jgi:hypothetical protein
MATNIQLPRVGANVRVTVRGRNHYYLTVEKQPFVYRTYVGTVTPLEKYDPPNTFCMTGDQFIRSRNIHMNNVVNIEYISGEPNTDKVRVFKVKSKDTNREYTVTVSGATFDCNCTGFHYRHKCKHVDGVKRKIA